MKKLDELKLKTKKETSGWYSLAAGVGGILDIVVGAVSKNVKVKAITGALSPVFIAVQYYFLGKAEGIEEVDNCVIPMIDDEEDLKF